MYLSFSADRLLNMYMGLSSGSTTNSVLVFCISDLYDIYHEIITCICKKNVFELTLLVTSIAVVICYQGWRNPEWTSYQCICLTCIYIRSNLG